MSGREIWVIATVWMALFSCRFPPRLRRCRRTRPELASSGAEVDHAVPFAMANFALVPNRLGSPTWARISAATRSPMPSMWVSAVLDSVTVAPMVLASSSIWWLRSLTRRIRFRVISALAEVSPVSSRDARVRFPGCDADPVGWLTVSLSG